MHHLAQLLITNVRHRPTTVAVSTPHLDYNYAQLGALTANFVYALRQAGLHPGEPAAILMENSADWIAAYFAVLLCNGVAMPLHVQSPASLLAKAFDLAEVRVVCVDERGFRAMAQWPQSASTNLTLVGNNLPDRDARYRVQPVTASSNAPLDAALKTAPGASAVVLFTAGSTGEPKGVVLSHQALLANARAIVAALDLHCDDRMLQVLPLAYSYGLSLLHTHFLVGGSLVLDNRWAFPKAVMTTLRDHRCTGFAGIASMFHWLLQTDCFNSPFASPLRYVTQAGGPLPKPSVQRLCAMIQPAELYVMYGLTEAGPRVSCLPASRVASKLASVGRPLDAVTVRIVRPDGSPASVGEHGQIVVQSPAVMSAYLKAPEATATALTNGWLQTGDIGYLDRDGYLYIVDRASEFIKVAGHRIGPGVVKDLLIQHPAVRDAIAVGLNPGSDSECLGALVTVVDSSNVTVVELIDYCRQRLPSYYRPAIIKIVRELPLTPDGKPALVVARKLLQP